MKWTARFKRQVIVCTAVAAFAGASVGVRAFAADKGGDITDIMKKAFKGAGGPGGKRPAAGAPGAAGGAQGAKKPSLVQKAIDGSATPDDLKSLLGYCKDLSKTKPPKGDQKDWDDRCTKMVNAVELIAKGDKSGGAALKTSSNCKECHNLHKE